MRRTVLILSVILPLTASVSGQVASLGSPEIRIAITPDEIAAHTGQQPGAIRLRSIAADQSGRLHVYTQDNSFDDQAALIRIDLSGTRPRFETLATEAELLAAVDTTFLPPNFLSMTVAQDGTIFLQEYIESPDFQDDIIRVVPGDPPTVESVWRGAGVSGISLDQSGEDLLIGRVQRSFGAPRGELIALPLDGGPPETLLTDREITQVTGAEFSCIRTSVAPVSDGRIVFFDEAFFGGSDHLLERLPTGEVRVLVPRDELDPGSTMGVSAMAIDNQDRLYLWDEFPESYRRSLLVLEEGGRGARMQIPIRFIDQQLSDLTGRPAQFDLLNYANALAVWSDEEHTVLWAIDDREGNIVSFTFPVTSP